jgi:hypothetical protein
VLQNVRHGGWTGIMNIPRRMSSSRRAIEILWLVSAVVKMARARSPSPARSGCVLSERMRLVRE